MTQHDERLKNKWSKAEDDALREMILVKRFSCGVAANALNVMFRTREDSVKPFTRNSVIGRVHRLKLDGRRGQASMPHNRPPTERLPRKKQNKPAVQTSKPRVVMPKTEAQLKWRTPYQGESKNKIRIDTPAPFQLVDKTCQWITGDDPRTWTKCGAACHEGRNYCAEHVKRAYQPYVYAGSPAPMPGMRRW